MDYVMHIVVIAATYTVLTAALDLLAGRTGLLSVGQAVFFGIGGYSAALLAVGSGLPFAVSALVGAGIAGLTSLLLARVATRLHEDYLVLATLALQVVWMSVCNNWVSVTYGPLGVANIPRPSVLFWTVQSAFEFAMLTSAIAVVSLWCVHRIATSPLGRVLAAIREDQVLAASLGKDTSMAKVIVFVVSAGLSSVAGSAYAHYVTYIDPKMFGLSESVLIVSMVVIGGAGSLWGPVVGAVLLVAVPEGLRFLGLPNAVAGSVRQILYGSMLLVTLVVRPRGIMGSYGFGR